MMPCDTWYNSLFKVFPLSWYLGRQHGQEGNKKLFLLHFALDGCVNPLQPAEQLRLSATFGHCWPRSWCRHFHPAADILSSLCIPKLYLESQGEHKHTGTYFNNSHFKELLLLSGLRGMSCFLLQTEPWVGDRVGGQSPWWHRGWWTCPQVRQGTSKDLTLHPQSCPQAPALTPASVPDFTRFAVTCFSLSCCLPGS